MGGANALTDTRTTKPPGRLTAEASLQPPVCSTSEFNQLRAHLYRTTGISIPQHKLALIQGRLASRLRTLGLRSYRQYYHYLLEDDPDGAEFSEFVNALTTNKTDFFREQDHFSLLLNQLLPARVRYREQRQDRQLRIWCAASSTGEEPYSLAMTVMEYLEQHPLEGWDILILATDIDSRALGAAERGIYTHERIRLVPPTYRQKYFRPMQSRRGRTVRTDYQVVESVRNLVRFRRFNLMAEAYPFSRKFDIVFCRNVMIYFDPEGRGHVVRQIARHLTPEGYLVIGHSENLLGIEHPLVSAGPTLYRSPS